MFRLLKMEIAALYGFDIVDKVVETFDPSLNPPVLQRATCPLQSLIRDHLIYYVIRNLQLTQQTRDIHPMWIHCWASAVADPECARGGGVSHILAEKGLSASLYSNKCMKMQYFHQ